MSTHPPLEFARLVDAPALAASHAAPPLPTLLPWPLKPMASARSGIKQLADGRLCCWIKHEVLRGVTPDMLVWWFSHLEGDVMIQGRRVNRYRAWHPHDHVHVSYARRLPDGRVGPGAAIRIHEYLGANRRFEVNVVSDIERLDAGGFTHAPRPFGISGMVRMAYTFTPVEGGTLYENSLTVGGTSGWRRWITPLVQRLMFSQAMGLAWLRHNIEEVGQLERFLPALYRSEVEAGPASATTRSTSAP